MLVQQIFYMSQVHVESLVNYLEDIKFAIEVLLLEKTKEDIMEGKLG